MLEPLNDVAQVGAEVLERDQVATVNSGDLPWLALPAALATTQASASVAVSIGGKVTAMEVVVNEDLVLGNLDAASFDEIRETFAQPGRTFDTAFDELCGHRRFLVLRSRPGKGTRTAAMAMIERLKREKNLEPHTLAMSGKTGLSISGLETKRSWVYLLDLIDTVEDSQLSSKFGSALVAASETLVRTDSYLVVLADAEQFAKFGTYIQHLVRDLQPPDRRLVAKKRLQGEALLHDLEAWLDDGQITSVLDEATPGEAVEIAKLIHEADTPGFERLLTAADLKLDPAAEDTDFRLRVASVVARWLGWHTQLLDWHSASNRTAFQRNFLLTTAVLHIFPVRIAYVEAKRLYEDFNHDVSQFNGHRGPGVIELLSTISASIDSDGIVRFSRQRWAEAVLDYYWRDRPDDHGVFLRWLVRLPQSDSFPTADDRAKVAAHIVKVMSDLIMTSGRVDALNDVIDAWSAPDESMRLASGLLDKAALHPRLGRRVTYMMLRWSTSGNTNRRKAVAAVCGLEFGRLHTDKALVRLSHLIADEDPDVVAEAGRSVLRLWEQPTVGRELLAQLITWGSDGNEKRIGAARKLFATVAAFDSRAKPGRPDLLVRAMANEEDLDRVALGWRRLLNADQELDPLLEALHPWFEAARSNEEISADVVSVFERAAADGRRATGRLQKCGYLWRGSLGERDESPAGRFVRQLDRLSGRSADAGT